MILVVAATARELASVQDVERLCCGIGPVEAALATAAALAVRRPAALLHVGIAGATELEPGAVVIGSESVYCDIFDPGATIERVERVQPAAPLVEAARRALPDAHVQPIATCGRVGAGTGFAVEAMEGFSVLRAAQLAGVPAVEVRVISNNPNQADRSTWLIEDALDRLATIVPPLVEELSRCVR